MTFADRVLRSNHWVINPATDLACPRLPRAFRQRPATPRPLRRVRRRAPGRRRSAPAGEWLALVRAPEGLTIVRPARPEDDQGTQRWSALYGGDTAHGLDVPGMLAALLTPLAGRPDPCLRRLNLPRRSSPGPSAMVPVAIAALQAAGHVIA